MTKYFDETVEVGRLAILEDDEDAIVGWEGETGNTWGASHYFLTQKDVDALKEGKVIAAGTDEYAVLIVWKDVDA